MIMVPHQDISYSSLAPLYIWPKSRPLCPSPPPLWNLFCITPDRGDCPPLSFCSMIAFSGPFLFFSIKASIIHLHFIWAPTLTYSHVRIQGAVHKKACSICHGAVYSRHSFIKTKLLVGGLQLRALSEKEVATRLEHLLLNTQGTVEELLERTSVLR